MGLAVAHVTRNGLHTGAASRPSSSTQPQRSLLLSAAIVGLVLLLMPCMNTTTAATRFLSPLHATLFLALHRPAFSVFLVVILLQYQNELWQQSTEAAWSFPFFVCPIYYFIILSFYHFIILLHARFSGPSCAASCSDCPNPPTRLCSYILCDRARSSSARPTAHIKPLTQ